MSPTLAIKLIDLAIVGMEFYEQQSRANKESLKQIKAAQENGEPIPKEAIRNLFEDRDATVGEWNAKLQEARRRAAEQMEKEEKEQ